MIGVCRNRKLITVCLALIGMIILSACHSETILKINKNDTYSLDIHFSQDSALNKGKKCLDIVPLTEKQASAFKITEKINDKKIECSFSLNNQHISKAQKPFVTIKHYADTFQVQLAPLKKLDYLKSNQIDFKYTIVFPGPILSVNSSLNPVISDNKISWDNPELLAQGFTVVGQDHQGLTQTTKWLIFFGISLLVLLLILYLMREHELVKPKLAYIKKKGSRLREIAMIKFAGPLSALDFASQSSRRARRARRIAKANTDIPKKKQLKEKLFKLKKRHKFDPWAEAEETYEQQQKHSEDIAEK